VVTTPTLSHDHTQAQHSCLQPADEASVGTSTRLTGSAFVFLQVNPVRDFHLRPDTTNIKKAHQDFCESLLFMGKNVSHLAVTKQILLNTINFNVCMNDKFLGTFFNFFILLQAMTK